MFLGVALVRIHASINQKRLIGKIGVDHEHHDGFNHSRKSATLIIIERASAMQPEAMQRGTGDKSM